MTPNSVFFYPHAFNFWVSADQIQDLDRRLDQLRSVPRDKKILLWAIEIAHPTVLRHAIDRVIADGFAGRTLWLLQPSHYYPPELLARIEKNLHWIDCDLLLLNLHVNECGTSQLNTQWNLDTGRFLFPTGKPDRANRIGLLYRFYQAGLLDRCDWSLFVDGASLAATRAVLPNLDDAGFERFVAQHDRNLDGIEIYHCDPSSNHSNGYPFDGSLYARSSFRVISETMMMSEPIISEKTWITVINRSPFIMAGYPHSLRYLRDSGYRTFEHYLPRPDYDQIEDQEARFDAVVENTEFWLRNIHSQAPEISQDVEHNYWLLRNSIAKTLAAARNLAIELGEPHRSIYSLVTLGIEQYGWAAFYYNIKDPSWPDCFLEQSFKTLPSEIQQECIDRFGYQPKNNH